VLDALSTARSNTEDSALYLQCESSSFDCKSAKRTDS
jgi:hypothetical protein